MAGSLATRRDVYLPWFSFPRTGPTFVHHEGLVPASSASKVRRFSLGKENMHYRFRSNPTASEERPVSPTTYQTTKVGNRCGPTSIIGESIRDNENHARAAFLFRWKDLEGYSGVRTPSGEWCGRSRTTLQRASWNGSRPVVEVFQRSLGNQKVTRTSGTPGRLDMTTDTRSRGLTSAYGNMWIVSSALGVDMGVCDRRTTAFENSNLPRKLRSYECSFEA
ncbi:hypothetical protein EDB83DRAFT_2571896 [Lactarius deliciosus]|nr:hypothetical protein EDB83DRAFT_2571896 [Lactarius deliciosus]